MPGSRCRLRSRDRPGEWSRGARPPSRPPVPPPPSAPRFLPFSRWRPAGLSVGVARGPRDPAGRDRECRSWGAARRTSRLPAGRPPAAPRAPPALARSRPFLRPPLGAPGRRPAPSRGFGRRRTALLAAFGFQRRARAAALRSPGAGLGGATRRFPEDAAALRELRRRRTASARRLKGGAVLGSSWSLLRSSSEAPRQTAVVLTVGVGLEAGGWGGCLLGVLSGASWCLRLRRLEV